jgi:uncharacterized membrane protein
VSRYASLPGEQKLGLLAWAALLGLQPIWHAWLFPPQRVPVAVVLALTVIPLLLPLLALRNVTRALLGVGMLSLLYFCHGVAEAWSSAPERVLAVVEIVLTVGLIAVLGAGVRRPRAGASRAGPRE